MKPDDFAAIGEFVLHHHIGMVIVGPEDPLVRGIHDYFLADPRLKGIMVVGPVKRAAMLEGSKDFAKYFMHKYRIPTGSYRTFDKSSLGEGIAFLKTLKPPYVLKADGLAAGKGVIISHSLEEAVHELQSMIISEKFGTAGSKVIIEEYLDGIEVSVFILTDGKSYILLPEAKDYKRIGEGDTGLNTGGMGSISPVLFADSQFMEKVRARIIEPTIAGLNSEGIRYTGFIFFGLMNVGGDPYVIEYNARLGDPETESILPRIKNDLLELLIAASTGGLDKISLETDPRYSAAVMVVSGGYPEDYKKGFAVSGLDSVSGSVVFHAGTRRDEKSGTILTNGGRVMAVSSQAPTLEEALKISNANAARITFEGCYFRRDLGFDLTGLTGKLI